VSVAEAVRWRPRGRVFEPGGRPWLRTHASLPLTLPLGGDRCRVLFAGRDADDRSHVASVELDLAGGTTTGLSPEPLLAPGGPGTFDGDGVYAASAVVRGSEVYLYTIGWNRGVPAPLFYASIGLAVSDDGGISFRKHSSAPILARSEHDPCLVTSPCVLLDGGTWRMWYVSGIGWRRDGGRLRSLYDVKYAESGDGVSWRREGLTCIALEPGETNISRPCVLADGGRYRMWFAVDAGRGYALGYAESDDGLRWTRIAGDAGPPRAEWDGEAQAYPWVWRHEGRLRMLYNGNAFGREGFGLAEEAQP
jgi:hypothetical protein